MKKTGSASNSDGDVSEEVVHVQFSALAERAGVRVKLLLNPKFGRGFTLTCFMDRLGSAVRLQVLSHF